MELPKVIADNQGPIVSNEHNLTVDGVTYKLTRHGRMRYNERVGPSTDDEILRKCVGNPQAVWLGSKTTKWLRTYLSSPRLVEEVQEMYEDLQDTWDDALYEDLH